MKVYLEVYGCTANKSDATLIKGLIKNNTTYELVDSLQSSDLVIIVTCTVIGTTEQRMLHRMRVFKESGKKVIVTGCMAGVQVEKIKTVLPDAVTVPPNRIHTIFSVFEQKKLQKHPSEKPLAPKFFDSLVAPISISEGCQYACTYCITHLARGRLQSYPESTILRDVSDALASGCKEIQLTAQDTASYGYDTGSSLSALIKMICSIEGQYRIRIGMMNPRSLKKQVGELIKAYSYDQIYKFIHLPVQSGDNQILKLMNRGYTVEEFTDIITQIRKNIPDITLSTDIIVGFPTETEEQFQRSIELLNSIKPDVVNITRFSARPKTKAKTMRGRIPTEIVKERSRYLSSLCRQISLEKNQAFIGRKEMILTMEHGKNNTIVGRTRSYKPVVLREKVALGTFVSVEIIDAKETFLVGTLK